MVENEAMEDFEGIACTTENPDAVVVGLAPSLFNYEHMNKAFWSEIVSLLKNIIILLVQLMKFNDLLE